MARPGPPTPHRPPNETASSGTALDDANPGAGSPHGASLQRYYRRIAPRLLLHAQGRFVTPITSAPINGGSPAEVPMTPLCLAERRDLLKLCAAGAVAFHAPTSRADAPECPDQLVYALAGGQGDFEALKTAAATLADLLEELDLCAYPMLDGLGGLQLRVPLDARADYPATRALARRLARAMELRDSTRYSARPAPAGERLFIDYRLNERDSRPVLPYSLRPAPGWPVAAPLNWEMLADPDLDGRGLSRHRVMHWPQGPDPWADDPWADDPWAGDPWAGYAGQAGSVAQAHARLDRSATTV
ncbi:hypothetical protein [Alkalilimnicola sp. S0819]|uniref:non-homologous end-joining DNA ligase LigD n=1 Tax=Alkalilimnicola sp. S0819 TaxID=2613922 RepID=UPI0012615660|nr:hypothetical protein [Alkalilimnicola sp. S0819]KAB7627465.1 hypothetical protein F3N43_03080 [Alkalilimnicola sp. S0819]MPQ15614.1 hypothetical protein [Alkalilimnicola sp. S0819]